MRDAIAAKVRRINETRDKALETLRESYLDEMIERVEEAMEERDLAETVRCALLTQCPSFVEADVVSLADRCVLVTAETNDMPDVLERVSREHGFHVLLGEAKVEENSFTVFKFERVTPVSPRKLGRLSI